MAAQFEETLSESAELVQSSGGVFEVEDQGVLIFSKKQLGRFPAENEVVDIVKAVESGVSLLEAQRIAGENAPRPISFIDWLSGFFQRKQAR